MGKPAGRYLSGPKRAAHVLLAVVLSTNLGCAGRGLVRDTYPREYYRVPKQLPGDHLDKNPRFIVYGDNRPGWRAKEILLRRQTWLTWKQLYLPGIYQLYLIGTGIVGGVNRLRWAPDYGGEEARLVRDAVYEAARREGVDFIINTGDLVTDGARPKHWETFLKQNRDDVPLVTEFPYLPVIGNHEHANDSLYALPNYVDVFSYPPFYAFQCRDVELFILDSNYVIDQDHHIDDAVQDELFEKWFVAGPDSDGPAWLQGRLEASDKTFKIVIMHHPPLSFGVHYNNWTDPDNGNDLAAKRQKLLDLFREHDVRVVFNGHQHMYAHNTLTYVNDKGEEEVSHFVITGGGGAPLHRGYDEQEIAARARVYSRERINAVCVLQEVIYNYCIVDTDPERITIRVFEVSKSDTNGRLVDTIVVRRRGR